MPHEEDTGDNAKGLQLNTDIKTNSQIDCCELHNNWVGAKYKDVEYFLMCQS